MSADNTVVVAQFVDKCEHKYYKVAYIQSAESYEYSDNWPDQLADWYRVTIFKHAPTFYELANALMCADAIEKEQGYVEFGVQVMEYNVPLLDMSVEEAEKHIETFWWRKRWRIKWGIE